MSGYSLTPLPKKLGLKPGSCFRVCFGNADFLEEERNLGGWSRTEANFDVAVAFCDSMGKVSDAFNSLMPDMMQAAGLWIAWPKRASGVPTDCNENEIRDMGLALGLVDNKVCAIDEVWSGLRFVIRLRDRQPSAFLS